jgi:alkyldihydroxyacetonephosphate synthase
MSGRCAKGAGRRRSGAGAAIMSRSGGRAATAAPATRRRKHWGWGYADQQPSGAELEAAARGIRETLGFGAIEIEEPVPLEAVALPAPRLRVPDSLADVLTDDHYERVSHALGKAYRDVVRGFRGQFSNPPDLVAHPRREKEIEEVLSWCEERDAAAIPYGGGTSVVGGVEPRLVGGYAGAVSIDLGHLDRVLEVDPVSRAARIQAGARGPVLEEQLREHELTLRHFPQSFEFSTLGGWVATRAGGHFATLYTHFDDLVESVRALTPRGVWESRRLPGSGAGPSPDRLLIGSEGILGVITEAWVRVQERPRFKLSAGVGFDEFMAGARAVREISQAGLYPSNCRLLDALEAETAGASPGEGKSLLVLGFESAHHPVDHWMDVALECAGNHGGKRAEERGSSEEKVAGGSVDAWRSAFLAAPYLRDTFVACGVLSDTFETAITWDRFEEFHAAVTEAAAAKVREVCGDARLSCRFTHVYPDGPAPYFTVLAPAKRGGEAEQWDEVKAAASEAVIEAGGTITHHHAVGRDHRAWYDRQRPDAFAAALCAAKSAVDPLAILNPGVLVDPA